MLNSLFSKYPVKKYKKWETILKPGDKPNFVGLVRTGEVKVFEVNKSGQEIIMPFFKPVFDITAILAVTDGINRFNFQAISAVEMRVMPKEEFKKAINDNPEILEMVLKNVSNLFLNFAEVTGRLLSGNSLTKVALMITTMVDEKVSFPITHKMIAGLTGLTRETVTLQMLKMERMKLVDNKERKVTILNRKGLDKMIGK